MQRLQAWILALVFSLVFAGATGGALTSVHIAADSDFGRAGTWCMQAAAEFAAGFAGAFLLVGLTRRRWSVLLLWLPLACCKVVALAALPDGADGAPWTFDLGAVFLGGALAAARFVTSPLATDAPGGRPGFTAVRINGTRIATFAFVARVVAHERTNELHTAQEWAVPGSPLPAGPGGYAYVERTYTITTQRVVARCADGNPVELHSDLLPPDLALAKGETIVLAGAEAPGGSTWLRLVAPRLGSCLVNEAAWFLRRMRVVRTLSYRALAASASAVGAYALLLQVCTPTGWRLLPIGGWLATSLLIAFGVTRAQRWLAGCKLEDVVTTTSEQFVIAAANAIQRQS